MARKLIIFAFLLCVLLYHAAAANLTVSITGDSFFAGQTVLAKVSMHDFSVSKLSLLDSSGSKTSVGYFHIPYDMPKDEYYVYFNLPSSLIPGTYHLNLSNRIMESGTAKWVSAADSFSVSKGSAVFAITPAVIKPSSYSSQFRIDLRHTYGTEATASVSSAGSALKPVRDSITVLPGETKSLFVNYNYSALKEGDMLRLSAPSFSYEVPIIGLPMPKAENATANNTVQEPEQIPVPADAIRSADNISVIRHTVKRNKAIAGPVRFVNTFSAPLHDVTFSSMGIPSLEFNTTVFPVVMPGEKFTQYIWINREKNIPAAQYRGEITANSREGTSLSIRLELNFEEIAEPAENKTVQQVLPNQSVLIEDKIPDVKPLNISVNYSDITQASEEEKTKGLKIALIIIAAVIAIIALLAFRLRPITKFRHMKEYAVEKREEHLPKKH